MFLEFWCNQFCYNPVGTRLNLDPISCSRQSGTGESSIENRCPATSWSAYCHQGRVCGKSAASDTCKTDQISTMGDSYRTVEPCGQSFAFTWGKLNLSYTFSYQLWHWSSFVDQSLSIVGIFVYLALFMYTYHVVLGIK